MLDVKLMLVNGAIKWLIGSDLLDFLKAQVAIVNSEEITGEEKRAKVFKEAKHFFASSFSMFINLGIEIAVAMLKNKLDNLDKQ